MGIINTIQNMDAVEFMSNQGNKFADVILTSPPYNSSRPGRSDKYNKRYDSFFDHMSNDDYIEWAVSVFGKFDKVLKDNGSVLFNMSYSSENTTLMFLLVAEIIKRTQFTLADTVIWKKNNALPNNRSANKLTRICEYVFVFCRKTEFKTFNSNKRVVSTIEKTGQRNFENVFNYIEAKNNDGSNDLNKATFSTELCEKLINIYAKPSSVVFDPFIGTGTTALAAIKLGHKYVGCEISSDQCEFARARIKKIYTQPTLDL